MKKTIKDYSAEYESKVTKNIADLNKVSVDIELSEETFTTDDGKDFNVKMFEFEGENYRVPDSVLKQLKAQIEENPKLKHFKVKKEGEGMKTTYTVIPLSE